MASEKSKKKESSVMPTGITEEMRESYLDYAMSVITARALPDVRDGLKPVHRRILYAMGELGLTAGAKFRKSATVVGAVLGQYHPHGDASIYDAMVKMAQDFSMRYPLVIGQGNFGSIDGDNPAAMRYTEAKLERISLELLNDLKKDTVEFRDNYDGTKREPEVLPAAVPNLLLNGTLGIAVGMATNIPPHNLNEIVDATIRLIENPEITIDDLLEDVQGPDFPTGAMIFNKKDIKHAYATGRGGIVVRGHADIDADKKGRAQIVITSLPYRVIKASFIQKIADLVKSKKIEDIRDIRDESTKDIRIVIELKNSAQPQKVLNALYKHTQLEDKFHVNMVGLVEGIPQTLSLKSMLEVFVDHRRVVVKRRTEYELKRAEAREHILSGLKKALDHIDEIIALIKKAKDTPTAHANLMRKFKFSDKQATAILEMRLQRLAGLERQKIEDELKDIKALIKKLKDILGSKKKMMDLIVDELMIVKDKYGDERRTKVLARAAKNISVEDMIPEEDNMLVFTRDGYIKRTDPDEYRRQKRGGVGVVDLSTKDEDVVTTLIRANTHSDLLFFSDKGKVYRLKMYEIPEGKRATKGKSIMNFLPLVQDEFITTILPIPKVVKEGDFSIMMATRNGTAKRVDASRFYDVRSSGIIAVSLRKDDKLVSTAFCGDKDEALLITQNGQSIRFKVSDVREMGRSAAGVSAIKLKKGDRVVAQQMIRKDMSDPELFVISENGYGKRTKVSEYSVQRRAGSGLRTAKLTDKTGKLVSARVVTKTKSEAVAISAKSQVIRIDLNDVPTQGRQTQGVRIMKLRARDKVAALISF